MLTSFIISSINLGSIFFNNSFPSSSGGNTKPHPPTAGLAPPPLLSYNILELISESSPFLIGGTKLLPAVLLKTYAPHNVIVYVY